MTQAQASGLSPRPCSLAEIGSRQASCLHCEANATLPQVANAPVAAATIRGMAADDLQSVEQVFRRARLQAAVDMQFNGNESELGRQLGYGDGAFIRQMLKGRRSITEKTIAKVHALRGMRGWFDASSPPEGMPPLGGHSGAGMVAHLLSQVQPEDESQELTWEVILTGAVLPARFSLAVPDDALTPRTPRGSRFLFSTAAKPMDGDVVIVKAGNGRAYVRLYFAAAGDEWEARSRDPAHASMQSARDGLTLLATATHRAGGQG